MGIDGLSAEGVDGPGCKNVVFGRNIHIVQDAGGCHIGGHEDAVGSGALGTVTGHGTHGEGILAHALGDEGGGAAAVAVGGPLAAESQHGFALFVAAEAHGVIGTAAVIHHDDQGAVLLDTHHGAGGIVIAPLFGGVHQLAVLDHHAEGNANRMEQNAVSQVFFKLGLVEGLDIAGDIAICILEYIQNGGGGIQHSSAGGHLLTEVADALAVIDQHTGGIGAVIQVGVHAADNVVAQIIFIIPGHFGQLLVGPVCLVVRILGQLIDLIVSGNDGYIGVGRVNLNHMKHLSAGAGGIVEHDLGLNRRTGDKDIVLLGNYVVVAVGAEAGSVKDHIVFFPVGDGRQSGTGHQAQDHGKGQQHSYSTNKFLVHGFPPWFDSHFYFTTVFLWTKSCYEFSGQLLPEEAVGKGMEHIVPGGGGEEIHRKK